MVVGDSQARIDAAHVYIGLALDAAVIHDMAQVRVHCDQALAILQGLRDVDPGTAPLASSVRNILAEVAFEQGDDTRAAQLAEEALAEQRRTGFDWAAADSLFLLALVACQQGDIARAASLCRESLELTMDHRDPQTIPVLLDQVAFLAHLSNRAVEAVRLLGAADVIYRRLGLEADREWRDKRGHHVATLCESLGKQAYAESLAEGHALPLNRALANGISVATASDSSGPPSIRLALVT